VVKFSGTGSNLVDLVKASGVAGILLNRVGSNLTQVKVS